MDEIVKQFITVFFGVFQALILVVIAASFKTYWDVRLLKKNMNAAFKKIRTLEKRESEFHKALEAPSACSRESKESK